MTDHVIKSGDVLPAIAFALSRADGQAADLSSAANVYFVMRDPTAATPKVNAVATVVGNPANGQVAYFWQPGDTDTPGIYDGSWVVNYPAGPQTFPTDDYLEIDVQINLVTPGAITSVRPTDGIRPTVKAVGSLIPNRGLDRSRVQFGPGSVPSYSQVQGIVDLQAGDLDAVLAGAAVTPALAGQARYLIALAAAATVELAFFPEQGGASSTSAILWSRYQTGLTEFRMLLAEEGGGPPMSFGMWTTSPTLSAVTQAPVVAAQYALTLPESWIWH